MKFIFKLYTSREEIEQLLPAWDELVKETPVENPIFQSAFWCKSWLEANSDAEPKIATLWDGEKLIALLPLMESFQRGTKFLEFISAPECEYGHMLVAKDVDAKAALEEIICQLKSISNVDMLKFINVPEGDVICKSAEPKNCKISDLEFSSILDVTQFENFEKYLAGRSRNSRRGLKKKIDNLKKQGDVTFELAPITSKFLDENIARIIQWKEEWFEVNGIAGRMFDSETLAKHLYEQVNEKDDYTALMGSVIKLDGEIIVCDIMMMQRNVLYSYVAARNLKYNDFSVGTVMDIFLFQHALEHKIDAIDYLPGPNAAKLFFGNKQVVVYDVLFPFTAKGKFKAMTQRLALRKRVKDLFYKLPLGLRKSILKIKS